MGSMSAYGRFAALCGMLTKNNRIARQLKGQFGMVASLKAKTLDALILLTIAAILLTIAAIGLRWAWPPQPQRADRPNNELSAEIKAVLDTGERFVLLTLDPTNPAGRDASNPLPDDAFHDYRVLGRTEISDRKERAELLQALYQGVQESDGSVALCFSPRHGISATLAGETVDLVICFECLSMEVHSKTKGGVLTTDYPRSTFNRVARRAGLTVAPEH